MKKKIKFKMILIVTSFILLIGQVTYAEYVYSVQRLNDGSTIKMCRLNNGKVDYCTAKDALKAMDVINNPQKYMTPTQKAQWEKNNKEEQTREAKKKSEELAKINLEKTIIPNSITIVKTIDELRSTSSKLEAKHNAGLDVSKEQDVLDFKYKTLFDLKNYESDFEKAYNAYKDGDITKEEYNLILSKIKKQDETLKQPLAEILSVTYSDLEKAKAEYAAKKQEEDRVYRKKQAGKRLFEQGKLYLPPTASNWAQHGVDALELFK